MTDRYGMVNPAIFEDLQARVDEDSNVRDVRDRPVCLNSHNLNIQQELREIIQTLEKQGQPL